MPDDQDTLERTIARLRKLSPDKLELVDEFLDGIAEIDGAYVLSEAELAVLRPALARAKAGDFADDNEVEKLLNEPWK
jgi:hypothetical protein